jgi:hypothetical protein
MHKQVYLSRDATTLDFPVAPLVGDKPSQVESIIAVETKFGRAVVANRIPANEAEIWAHGLSHVANDHRYYELTHESLNHQFEHYYLLLQDKSGATRAIQPFLIVDQDLATGLPGPIRSGLQALRRRFPGTLYMRMLMVGCSAGEGHLARDRKSDAGWVTRALGEALQPVARALRSGMIVFKDFPQSYREPLAPLKKNGYARVPSMPGSRLDLKFANFEEYLDAQEPAPEISPGRCGPENRDAGRLRCRALHRRGLSALSAGRAQVAIQVRGTDQVLLPQPRPHDAGPHRLLHLAPERQGRRLQLLRGARGRAARPLHWPRLRRRA